jgi:hypothetical protein
MYILIPKLSRFLQLSKIKNKVNLGPKLYFPFFLVHCLREERENDRISIVERKGKKTMRVYPMCFFSLELALYGRSKPANNFGFGLIVGFQTLFLGFFFRQWIHFTRRLRCFFFLLKYDWKWVFLIRNITTWFFSDHTSLKFEQEKWRIAWKFFFKSLRGGRPRPTLKKMKKIKSRYKGCSRPACPSFFH